MSSQTILLVASVVLFVCCLSSGASFKFGVPAVLLFLIIGMVAGEDGFGIKFSNPKTAQFIGIVSLSFILFSGGLETKWRNVKPVLWQSITLASLGVLLTAVILGFFVHLLVPGMDIKTSMLIGAVVSSTDAAAVFSILRSNNTNLSARLFNTLEFESAANDPMAYLLTITMIGVINKDVASAWEVVFMLLRQIGVGFIFAVILGKLAVEILNKMKLASDGLYPVLLMALNLFTFAVTEKCGGNGFLAVYISGLILGNSKFLHKQSLINFYEGQSNLWQIILFITLGLLVTPSKIPAIAPVGISIALIMIIIARPAAVFISTIFFSTKKLSVRERLFVAWAGIRGASSVVFATMPIVLITSNAAMSRNERLVIFYIVFFISIFSVLIQGTTLSKFAKWIKLKTVKPSSTTYSFVEIDGKASSFMMRVKLSSQPKAAEKLVMELGLPKSVLITTIIRGSEYLIPKGNTKICANDEMLITASSMRDFEMVKDILGVEPEEDYL